MKKKFQNSNNTPKKKKTEGNDGNDPPNPANITNKNINSLKNDSDLNKKDKSNKFHNMASLIIDGQFLFESCKDITHYTFKINSNFLHNLASLIEAKFNINLKFKSFFCCNNDIPEDDQNQVKSAGFELILKDYKLSSCRCNQCLEINQQYVPAEVEVGIVTRIMKDTLRAQPPLRTIVLLTGNEDFNDTLQLIYNAPYEKNICLVTCNNSQLKSLSYLTKSVPYLYLSESWPSLYVKEKILSPENLFPDEKIVKEIKKTDLNLNELIQTKEKIQNPTIMIPNTVEDLKNQNINENNQNIQIYPNENKSKDNKINEIRSQSELKELNKLVINNTFQEGEKRKKLEENQNYHKMYEEDLKLNKEPPKEIQTMERQPEIFFNNKNNDNKNLIKNINHPIIVYEENKYSKEGEERKAKSDIIEIGQNQIQIPDFISENLNNEEEQDDEFKYIKGNKKEEVKKSELLKEEFFNNPQKLENPQKKNKRKKNKKNKNSKPQFEYVAVDKNASLYTQVSEIVKENNPNLDLKKEQFDELLNFMDKDNRNPVEIAFTFLTNQESYIDLASKDVNKR